MKKIALLVAVVFALFGITISATCAQSLNGSAILVTPDNFVRAETDRYFKYFESKGAFGKFFHYRELPLENTGVRPNRDTLYSESIFDLEAGPVTITKPDAGTRFMSMIVFDEDHYVHGVYYDKGSYTLIRDAIGTRYVSVFFRTLVNPNDPVDMKAVYALQDAVKVEQPGGPGKLETPNWDAASQKKVRDALIALNDTLPDLRRAFGRRDQVDPVRHLIATASAWGGNPDEDAIYLNVTPAKNDGTVVYKLNVPGGVPVDAFWSVIVYTADGHLQKNELNAYSLNSITAKKDADGSIAVQFGGCDGKVPNCLPIMERWNYMVRLYRPREETVSGKWNFPEAQAVD
jgi:hypothetical protein